MHQRLLAPGPWAWPFYWRRRLRNLAVPGIGTTPAVDGMPSLALRPRPAGVHALACEPHLHRDTPAVREWEHLVHVLRARAEDEQPTNRRLHAQASSDHLSTARLINDYIGDARLATVDIDTMLREVEDRGELMARLESRFKLRHKRVEASANRSASLAGRGRRLTTNISSVFVSPWSELGRHTFGVSCQPGHVARPCLQAPSHVIILER